MKKMRMDLEDKFGNWEDAQRVFNGISHQLRQKLLLHRLLWRCFHCRCHLSSSELRPKSETAESCTSNQATSSLITSKSQFVDSKWAIAKAMSLISVICCEQRRVVISYCVVAFKSLAYLEIRQNFFSAAHFLFIKFFFVPKITQIFCLRDISAFSLLVNF